MSSRPVIKYYPVVTDGDMSADITSAVTIIDQISMVSYDISWVGTSPAGNITVEVSNTYRLNADGTVKSQGNWTALTLSAATAVSGNTGNGFIDVTKIAAYAIRLKYTRASGTGVLNVTVAAKVA